MIFLSPGVKSQEIDYSTYVGQISSCICGFVGGGSKGEIGRPTLCTSPANYVDTFGQPLESDYGGLAALEFLKQGNQLYYCRMAESTVATASATLSSGMIRVEAKEPGSFFNDNFALALTDVKDDGTFTLGLYKNNILEEQFTASLDASSEHWIEDLNSYWVNFIYDPITEDSYPQIAEFTSHDFVRSIDGKWHFKGTPDTTSIGNVSFNINTLAQVSEMVWSRDTQVNTTSQQAFTAQDLKLLDGETTRSGFSLRKVGAQEYTLQGTKKVDPQPEMYEPNDDAWKAAHSNDGLSAILVDLTPIVGKGEDQVHLVQTNQAINKYYGAAWLANDSSFVMNAQGVATKTKDYTAKDLDEFTFLVGKDCGDVLLDINGTVYIIHTNEADIDGFSANAPSYTPETVGAHAAVTTSEGLAIAANFNTPLDFSKGPWEKEFKVTLTTVTGLKTEEVIVIESVNYGEQTLVQEGTATGPVGIVQDEPKLVTTREPVKLSGGRDGLPLTSATVIGRSTTEGLQAFRNADELDINILGAPGHSAASVVAQLIDVAESREDCIALIDPPQGLSPQDVIKWHNGELGGENPDYPKKALNSSYAALFYPWVKVSDIYSGTDRWAPPSGVVAGAFAYNDNVGQPWFAPAGLNRGMLNSVVELERSLNQGERDALYGNGNRINCLINYKRQGISIWGQCTLQRKTSATDRINVRRLVNMVRKSIAISTAYTLFEQNDELAWRKWKGMIEPYLENIKQSRGLYDFKVVMDSTTVTPYHQDRSEMPGLVYLKPTKTAEFIPLSFILTSSGATFTD